GGRRSDRADRCGGSVGGPIAAAAGAVAPPTGRAVATIADARLTESTVTDADLTQSAGATAQAASEGGAEAASKPGAEAAAEMMEGAEATEMGVESASQQKPERPRLGASQH